VNKQRAEAWYLSPFAFYMRSLQKEITAIRAGKNPRVRRSHIFLDGKFAFSLDNEVIFKESLKVGLKLSSTEIDLLTRADRFQRCLNAAFQFLSYRPRSESETRTRLQRRGYADEEIENTVAHLKRLALLDDAAFAEFWKENRTSFKPRGQRMLKLELRRKGVESGVIDEAIENVDEADNAYRSALTRARTLPAADYRIFRQRLGGYLQRRGFSYGVINSTVKRVWQEKTGLTGPSPEITEETYLN
jgi:regulatory protein